MVLKLIGNIWHRKFFVIYMIVLGMVLGFVVRRYVVKEEYTYSLNYYITNSELAKIVVDTSSLVNDSQMASSCRIILKSELTLETLGEMLVDKYGEEYLSNYFTIVEEGEKKYIDTEELSDCIKIENVDEGTAVLGIEITTPYPYLSADIGNKLTFLASNIVYYLVGVDYISPYENARLNSSLEDFGVKKAVACGGLAGLAAAVLIIFLYAKFYKNIITDKADIDRAFDILTLGEIPYYEIKGSDFGKES